MKKLLLICALLLSFLTSYASDIVWVSTSSTNWHSGACWQGGVVPSGGDTAVFNSTSVVNAIITSNISVGGIRIETGYTGTITQSSGTITIASYGFIQSGGTFVGGSSDITISGYFTLNNGTFVSTSGALTLSGYEASVTGGTFNHNNGTVYKTGGTAIWNFTQSIKNLVINTQGNFTTTSLHVLGNVDALGWNVHNGTMEVEGNYKTYFISQSSSLGKVVFTGSNNQLLDTNNGTGCISGVEVNKTGGVLTVQDTILVRLDWTNISSGANVDVSGAEIKFIYENDVTSNGMVFNDVTVSCPGWFNAVDKMQIAGLAKFSSFNTVNGLMEVSGNVLLTGASQSTSTAILKFVGANNQTLGANGTSGVFSNILVQKSGGSLTVSDTIKLSQGLTWISGTVNTSGSTIIFYGGSQTIDAEGINFNNVQINSQGSVILARPLQVDGDFTLSGVNLIEGERVEVKGNYSSTNTFFWGNGVETYLMGSNNQTVNLAGTIGLRKSIFINKPSGIVSLTANLNLSGGLQNINVISGTLDLNGFNLNLGGTLKNSGLIKLIGSEVVTLGGLDNSGQGTVSYYGNGTYSTLALGDDYYHLTVAGNVTQDYQLSVLGNLNITGTLNSNSYNLFVAGNFNNSGTYTSGANSVYLIGKHQTITGSNSFNNLIKRNNTSASLTFPSGSTQTVSGILELDGTAGDLLVLKSSSSGSTWSINHTGSLKYLSYLNISDSVSVSTLDAKSNSTDSGNNTNWVFTTTNALIWTGSVNNNFSNAGNWAGSVVPTANDIIEFLSGSSAVSIDIDANVAGVVLGSGFSGSVTLATNKTLSVGFNGITISGGSLVGNTKKITSSGDLAISNGLFNSVASDVEIKGSVQLSGGTLKSSSYSFKVGANWTKTGGTFDALGSVTFNGFGGQTILAGGADSGSDFADVNVNFGTVVVSSALKVNGNLTVNSGQLKNNTTIQLAGSLNNNGGFINDQSSSLWVLNGTTAQTVKLQNHILKDIQISNTANMVTFLDELNANELKGDAGASIFIEKGKFVEVNKLTLNGTSAQPIGFKSNIAQQNAHVAVSGVQTLSYVDARGIDGQYGPTLNGTDHCVDLGYNLNWSFPSNSGKPVVSFTPASDVFETSVSVSIASTGTAPVIYYTLNGSTPTTSSSVYSAPLNITATTTIKAISVDGANTSIIFSKVYTAVQNAIDDGLVYPVKSYGLNAIIFLGDVRRFEGAAWHVGIDGIMNTSDDYRVPDFDKYIVWSATQGTIAKITNTGGAIFTGNGYSNYYTVTLTLGSKSYTGCNNSMPVRESAHGCPHFGTPDNSTNTFADSVENIESVCLPQAVLSLPTLGKSVVLNIVRDAGFYNVVPFGVGRAGRMSGFHELKEISSTRVNILFMNEKAGGWYPFDLNSATSKYYRDGGDQGYAEKIIESNVLTGYKYTDPKGNVLVFKKSLGTNYYRVTESINPFGQKITYDYQSATFLLITDASGNRYEVTAEDAIDGVNQISQIVTKPYGSSLSKTWVYDYNSSGYVNSQLFVNLFSALGYGEFKYDSDIHGNPTMFQDYKGYQYLNEFDDVWRNTKSILPTGDFTTKVYSGKNGAYDVKVTDTSGLLTTISRNQTPGRILTTKVIAPDNVITELTYDTKGYITQKKKKITSNIANDITAIYEFDNYHYLTKETILPLIANQITINEWDSHGNITKVKSQNGNINLYAYTNENLLTSITEAYGVLNLVNTNSYNNNGSLLSNTDSSGNVKIFETNSFGFVTKETDELGQFNSFSYNAFGSMTEATDKFSHLNVYEYNQNNLITKSTDARGASKFFQYDGNNNLTSFTNQFGVLTINTFNSINKKTSLGGDPDIPENLPKCFDCKVATQVSALELSYEYAWDGKLKSFTDLNQLSLNQIQPLSELCIIDDQDESNIEDSEFKNYTFTFKKNSNNIFILESSDILDVETKKLQEFESNFKIYDLFYLDVSGNVLYTDQVTFGMNQIDELIVEPDDNFKLQVNSIGPKYFYKMKFVIRDDSSLIPANSSVLNVESVDPLYSNSRMNVLSSNKKVSKTRKTYAWYFLRDFQIYPAQLKDSNNNLVDDIDEFGNEFPTVERGDTMKRLHIISTGVKHSDTTGDKAVYLAYVDDIVSQMTTGDNFFTHVYKANIVIYELDKNNASDYDDLPKSDYPSTPQNLTTRFQAFFQKRDGDYSLKIPTKNKFEDLKTQIYTQLKNNFLSPLDYIALVANNKGQYIRAHVEWKNMGLLSGIYFADYPSSGPSVWVHTHETTHAFFHLKDEYQSGAQTNQDRFEVINDFTFDTLDGVKGFSSEKPKVWNEMKWKDWVIWPDDNNNTTFGKNNNKKLDYSDPTLVDLIFFQNTEVVLAFPKTEATSHYSPCAGCLMRDPYSTPLPCVICRETIHNAFIGEMVTDVTPKGQVLIGSRSSDFSSSYKFRNENTLIFKTSQEIKTLKVDCTDKNYFFGSVDNFTYTWTVRVGNETEDQSLNSDNGIPNQKTISAANYPDATTFTYKCVIQYSDPERIKYNANEKLSFDNQFTIKREVNWKVVKVDTPYMGYPNVTILMDTALGHEKAFSLDFRPGFENTSKPTITFSNPQFGTISTLSYNNILYTHYATNSNSVDHCTFKIENYKHDIINGTITFIRATSTPFILDKTVVIHRGPDGNYGTVVINYKNGIDYFSINSYVSLNMSPILGKEAIFIQKNASKLNEASLHYLPSDGPIKGETFPVTISNGTSSMTANITIIDGDL